MRLRIKLLQPLAVLGNTRKHMIHLQVVFLGASRSVNAKVKCVEESDGDKSTRLHLVSTVHCNRRAPVLPSAAVQAPNPSFMAKISQFMIPSLSVRWRNYAKASGCGVLALDSPKAERYSRRALRVRSSCSRPLLRTRFCRVALWAEK